MANKGPILQEVKEQFPQSLSPAVAAPTPPPPTGSKEVVIAACSALLGALLAVGGNLLQENIRIGNHAPSVTVSSVRLFTPELTVPNKDNPSPPSNVDKELDVLTHHLGLTDDKMNIPTDQASALIKAATKTASLASMDSPLKFLKVDVWVDNIRAATKDVIAYYTAENLFEGLNGVLTDGSLNDEQAREAFVKLLDQNPEYPKIFWLADWPYTWERTEGTATSKKQDDKFTIAFARKPTFELFQVSSQPLASYAVAIGKEGLVLDAGNNVLRSLANRTLAVMISRFDRPELGSITKKTSDYLLREISSLQAFLSESDKLIHRLIKPKISVESTVFNSSRTPITIDTYGVLRVAGKNDMVSDIALSLSGTGHEEKSSGDDDRSDEMLKYATIDSGRFLKLTWSGEFTEATTKWDALTSAYNKGPLSCELTLETLGSLKARSPSAPFGTPSDDASKHALLLAAE